MRLLCCSYGDGPLMIVDQPRLYSSWGNEPWGNRALLPCESVPQDLHNAVLLRPDAISHDSLVTVHDPGQTRR
jgi:hypothetical protein